MTELHNQNVANMSVLDSRLHQKTQFNIIADIEIETKIKIKIEGRPMYRLDGKEIDRAREKKRRNGQDREAKDRKRKNKISTHFQILRDHGNNGHSDPAPARQQ